MRAGIFGRRKLDKFVHLLAILAFALNFMFVLVSGYFMGKFVKITEEFQESLRLLKGVVMEQERVRDEYIERLNPSNMKNLRSRQSGGENDYKAME